MANDLSGQRGAANRILVVLHAQCEVTHEEVVALLVASGGEAFEITILLPDELDPSDSPEGAIVVIPVDANVCDAPELEQAARNCSGFAHQIIVIFAPGFRYADLHPIAEKYGTQCGWSAAQLGDLLQSADDVEPRTSAGEPVDRPDPNQVKC